MYSVCFQKNKTDRKAKRAYFGLHDKESEGIFRWVSDNSTVTFTDWGPHQPDNAKYGEDCGQFWNDINYRWNDAPCSYKYGYICEKKFQ